MATTENTLLNLFNQALQKHQNGQISEAIERYLELLQHASTPENLLYLLGTAYGQLGQYEKALEFLEKALQHQPNHPSIYNNLGNVLSELNRHDEALWHYEQAAKLNPDFADAHNNLGNTLRKLNRTSEALSHYNQALTLRPDYVDAFNNRGNFFQEQQQPELAVIDYQRALLLGPNAEIYNNHGNALQALERLDEALVSFDRSLALKPDYAPAHYNRGDTLLKLNRLEEALINYNHSIAINPDFIYAYINRGLVLQQLKRLQDALSDYDHVISLNPKHAEAYNNRGAIRQELHQFDQAIGDYDQAIALNPDYSEAKWNKALVLLLIGDYASGWPLYEARQSIKALASMFPDFSQQAWHGQEDIRSKTLFVFAEQGLGDIVQFCRYLSKVQSLCKELIVLLPQPIAPLISTLACQMRVVIEGSPLPQFDAYCPLMSLPYAFKTTLETIPADIPYLFAQTDKVEYWQSRLGSSHRLRIGLVWSGNPLHKNDATRSIRLQQLQPLLDLPVEWHALQTEYRNYDLDYLITQTTNIQTHHLDFQDFSDTAALISCLDLVISVDTSVAHVAAAIGKPVWIMLPFNPDFRWLLNRDDSPWYSSARLFRQTQADDWDTVIENVNKKLVAHLTELSNQPSTPNLASPVSNGAELTAETYNTLGNQLQANKRFEEALQHYDRAIELNPNYAEAYNNCGAVLQNLHRIPEALHHFDQAIAIKHDYADAHNNRGAALHVLGQYDAALLSYEKALLLNSNYQAAYINRGILLRKLNRLEEALLNYDRQIKVKPDDVNAYNDRGNLLQQLHRPQEALRDYDQAIALQPSFAYAYNNRATILQKLKRNDEALIELDRAILCKPDYAEAYNNRGNLLHESKRLTEALSNYNQAIAIKPDYLEAYNNRGAALQAMSQLQEARQDYERALSLDPNFADALWNKSLLLLLTGDYPQGWPLYEARLRLKQTKNLFPEFPQMAWRGETDIRSKTLLIFAEQGLGDTLQFCRYLPVLQNHCQEIIMEAPPSLLSLLTTLKCNIKLIAKGQSLPAFDAYCPLLSLPYALKTTLETIPAGIPYLFAQADKINYWQTRLGPWQKLRVGLVWSGSTAHKNDSFRSIRLQTLLPLLEIPVEWHALHTEYRSDDLECLIRQHPDIQTHHTDFKDFSDTAALIHCLDLVISVDTSVAHLAAAIGKPVWVMLPLSPDFRWLMDRDDSPWYPTARLFRQTQLNHWDTVLDAVKAALQKWIQSVS